MRGTRCAKILLVSPWASGWAGGQAKLKRHENGSVIKHFLLFIIEMVNGYVLYLGPDKKDAANCDLRSFYHFSLFSPFTHAPSNKDNRLQLGFYLDHFINTTKLQGLQHGLTECKGGRGCLPHFMVLGTNLGGAVLAASPIDLIR